MRAPICKPSISVPSQSEGGRIFVGDNPKGAAVAYWCRAADASRVAETAWQTGDILAAGQQCGVGLTPHQIVLKRVGGRTSKIDEEIAKAIDAGVLKKFNAEYRTRRIRAKQRNESFMSYSKHYRSCATCSPGASRVAARSRRALSRVYSTKSQEFARESATAGVFHNHIR